MGESEIETGQGSVLGSTSEPEVSTPLQTQAEVVDADRYDDSGELRRYIPLSEVYNETEEIDMDEELLFAGIDEPPNYEQAAKEKDWRLAMNKELESIEKNGTWELTKLPDGHKVIDLKWVYKLK